MDQRRKLEKRTSAGLLDFQELYLAEVILDIPFLHGAY
jgi:hypothetical protein